MKGKNQLLQGMAGSFENLTVTRARDGDAVVKGKATNVANDQVYTQLVTRAVFETFANVAKLVLTATAPYVKSSRPTWSKQNQLIGNLRGTAGQNAPVNYDTDLSRFDSTLQPGALALGPAAADPWSAIASIFGSQPSNPFDGTTTTYRRPGGSSRATHPWDVLAESMEEGATVKGRGVVPNSNAKAVLQTLAALLIPPTYGANPGADINTSGLIAGFLAPQSGPLQSGNGSNSVEWSLTGSNSFQEQGQKVLLSKFNFYNGTATAVDTTVQRESESLRINLKAPTIGADIYHLTFLANDGKTASKMLPLFGLTSNQKFIHRFAFQQALNDLNGL